MKFFTDDDVVIINGKAVKKIYGGFGMGQPAILAKQVAELHGYELKEINRIVNKHYKWFDEGIDFINLAVEIDHSQHIADIKAFLLEFYTRDALNASKYVYLFLN